MPTSAELMPLVTLHTDVTGFLHYLRADKGSSPLTVATYENDLRLWLEHMAVKYPELLAWPKITPQAIRSWVMAMSRGGIAPATINRRLSALRSLFRYLRLCGLAEHDPLRSIKSLKKPKQLPKYLKEREMHKLIDEVEYGEDYEGQLERAIIVTLCHTGIRRGELLGLRLADVDWAQQQLRVLGKRNKVRLVPFGDEMAQVLRAMLACNEEGLRPLDMPLFVQLDGKPLTTGRLAKIVRKRIGEVSTIAKRTPHVLRHTYATAMLNNNAALENVKELLGHESVATTQVYTHTTIDELKKAYRSAHPRA